MERSSAGVKKTISAGRLSQQQPMFDIIEPSPPYLSFQQKARLRDASFSSYLKPVEPNGGNHGADDSEISIFDAQKYFNDINNAGSGDPKVSKRASPVNVTVSSSTATAANVTNLGRISEHSDFASVPRFSSASSSVDGYGRNYRTRSFHATPTASSEASWNSQTGLLSNPPGAIAISLRNPPRGDDKKRGPGTNWFLRRKCPCSGKKSVQIEEKVSEPAARTPSRLSLNSKPSIPIPSDETATQKSSLSAATTPEWLERRDVLPTSHRISAENSRFPAGLTHHHRVSASGRPFSTDGFTFPILNQAPPQPVKLVLNGLTHTNYKLHLEEPPRDSLEVFKPADEPIPTRSAIEHQSRRQSFNAIEDDIASDASSDLFEIESFSTQTTYPMMCSLNRRDSLDDASSFNARRLAAAAANNHGGASGGVMCCRQSLDEPRTPSIAPTECYPPSEVSIDWSVTTAEGFDRGSVTNFSVTASEMDEMKIMRWHYENEKSGGGGGGGRRRSSGGGGGGGGGLLSCRCEKAVNVGPQPVRCVGGEGQRGGSSTTRHVSSRPHIIVNKHHQQQQQPPPLARSHSARLSLPFAT